MPKIATAGGCFWHFATKTLARVVQLLGRARYRARAHRKRSEGTMKVADIMTKDPETVGPGTYIGDVAQMMRDLDVGIIPVVSDGELKGVITDRDITIRVTAAGLSPFEVTVQDFISPNPVSVSPGDDVEKAREVMSDR